MGKRKWICWLLAVLLLVWMGLAVMDCARLRNAPSGTEPLLILSVSETDNRTTYHGLGYTVSYYEDVEQAGDDLWVRMGYGAEFRLLGILIWAWVE